jgi:hypothetical protein
MVQRLQLVSLRATLVSHLSKQCKTQVDTEQLHATTCDSWNDSGQEVKLYDLDEKLEKKFKIPAYPEDGEVPPIKAEYCTKQSPGPTEMERFDVFEMDVL